MVMAHRSGLRVGAALRIHIEGRDLDNTKISAVEVASTPAEGDTYGAGETIEVEVTFNQDVDVTNPAGTFASLFVGPGSAFNQWRRLQYDSGSGSDTLSFLYTVAANDNDPDGVTIGYTVGRDSGVTYIVTRGTDKPVDPYFDGSNVSAGSQHKVDGSISAPDRPTGLTAQGTSTTTIALAWTPPENNGGRDITGYRIEVSPDGVDDWTVLEDDTESTDTTYDHATGLTAGTTRYYRVSAINSIGAGTASDVVGGKTFPELTVSLQKDDKEPLGEYRSRVSEGGHALITVTLSAAPEREVTVPLAWTNTSAETGDYFAAAYTRAELRASDRQEPTAVATDVTFAEDATQMYLRVVAVDDSFGSPADDLEEVVEVGFGASLPSGITAGTPATYRDHDRRRRPGGARRARPGCAGPGGGLGGRGVQREAVHAADRGRDRDGEHGRGGRPGGVAVVADVHDRELGYLPVGEGRGGGRRRGRGRGDGDGVARGERLRDGDGGARHPGDDTGPPAGALCGGRVGDRGRRRHVGLHGDTASGGGGERGGRATTR